MTFFGKSGRAGTVPTELRPPRALMRGRLPLLLVVHTLVAGAAAERADIRQCFEVAKTASNKPLSPTTLISLNRTVNILLLTLGRCAAAQLMN